MSRAIPRWLRHLPVCLIVAISAVTTGGGFPG